MLDFLADRTSKSPDKLAVIHKDSYLSYSQLNQKVNSMCSQLSKHKVGLNSKVGILLPNCVEFIVFIHAMIRLKATVVPINIRLTASEIEWQINQAEVTHIICNEDTEYKVENSGKLTILSLNPSDHPHITPLTDVNDQQIDVNLEIDLNNSQGILFTSGTTGKPKGAIVSLSNQYYSALASSERLGSFPSDRWILCIPLYHVGGLSVVFRCCINGTTIILHDKFDEQMISNSIEKNDATLISVVPVMLQRLIEYSYSKLRSLRVILVGGDNTPTQLLNQCIKLNLPIAITYGSTETVSQFATSFGKDLQDYPNSVGKPLQYGSFRIVDDLENEVQTGDIGEIVVKGSNVISGYINQQNELYFTSQNEFKTGDLGYTDVQNNLYIIQRRSDLIISGGENIYPKEIEDVLNAHEEIIESCIVGLPDEQWGSTPAALIVKLKNSNLDKSSIISYLEYKVAKYKIPRRIKFTENLPRTHTGKIIRNKVKEILSEK
ncbi:MAG: o-succinylbenzoate--CoA ligase [Candidatus Kariarchaeaceae archaeon]|jgi:O-succinylbenzoic acid--CoA ligase